MASTESATHQAETLTAFRLGDWHVDPVSKQISRDGETVRIDPRNMRVLALLASRAGAIVPQREIEEIVWSGSIVTSDSIYQSIAQLRRALGEDKSRRYIDTVPRRGYRLLVPVTPIAVSSPPETTTSSAQSSDISVFPTQNDARSSARTARIAALVLAGVGVLAAVVWATRVATVEDREHEQSPRVAVSPPATAAVVPPALSSGLSTDHQLPQSYQGASQYRRSIKRLTAVLESVSATSGPDHLSLVPTLVQLANLHPLVSDPVGCEQFARRGLDILVQHGKEASPEGVELNATLAEAFTDTGRFADAEKQLRHTLDLSREVHGPAHYATVSAMDQLALLCIAEGRYAEAVTEARAAIAAYEHVPDRVNTRNAYLISTLTWALTEQGNYREAIKEGRKGLNAISKDDPPAPYLVAYAHHFLGEALLKAGELAEAEALLRREVEIFAGIPHCEMDTARAESALGEALLRQGRLDDARVSLDRASGILESGDGWRERKSRSETAARVAMLGATTTQVAAR